MRRLVLLRHAKSDYPAGVDDHERPLNARGRRDAPEAGRWIGAQVPVVGGALVLVSTARRTQETWELAAAQIGKGWGAVPVRDESLIYEAPVSTLEAVVAALSDDVTSALLIGHNPGLVTLVARRGLPSEQRDAAIHHFPTSTIVVLQSEASTWQTALAQGLDVVAVHIARG